MSDSESPSPLAPGSSSLAMILPFVLGVARSHTGSQLNQIVVLDHAARTVVVFEGHVLDSLLHELSEKSGPLPASKASIEAMPRVGVVELGIDCAICLEGFEVGVEAREMPCKHWYHSECIEKWLGVHGTCPVCRFAMPVEVKKNGGDEESDTEGREGRIVVVNLWVRDGERMNVEIGSESEFGDSNSESQDEIMMDAIDDSSTQDHPRSEDLS